MGRARLPSIVVVVFFGGTSVARAHPAVDEGRALYESGELLPAIEAFARALESYRLDTGKFPETGEGLQVLVTRPADSPRWRGPYLQKEVPLDPWGQAYAYKRPGANGKDFEIVSYGRDGRPGGSDEDADLSN